MGNALVESRSRLESDRRVLLSQREKLLAKRVEDHKNIALRRDKIRGLESDLRNALGGFLFGVGCASSLSR